MSKTRDYLDPEAACQERPRPRPTRTRARSESPASRSAKRARPITAPGERRGEQEVLGGDGHEQGRHALGRDGELLAGRRAPCPRRPPGWPAGGSCTRPPPPPCSGRAGSISFSIGMPSVPMIIRTSVSGTRLATPLSASAKAAHGHLLCRTTSRASSPSIVRSSAARRAARASAGGRGALSSSASRSGPARSPGSSLEHLPVDLQRPVHQPLPEVQLREGRGREGRAASGALLRRDRAAGCGTASVSGGPPRRLVSTPSPRPPAAAAAPSARRAVASTGRARRHRRCGRGGSAGRADVVLYRPRRRRGRQRECAERQTGRCGGRGARRAPSVAGARAASGSTPPAEEAVRAAAAGGRRPGSAPQCSGRSRPCARRWLVVGSGSQLGAAASRCRATAGGRRGPLPAVGSGAAPRAASSATAARCAVERSLAWSDDDLALQLPVARRHLQRLLQLHEGRPQLAQRPRAPGPGSGSPGCCRARRAARSRAPPAPPRRRPSRGARGPSVSRAEGYEGWTARPARATRMASACSPALRCSSASCANSRDPGSRSSRRRSSSMRESAKVTKHRGRPALGPAPCRAPTCARPRVSPLQDLDGPLEEVRTPSML